jgi:polyhydroxybutyrate depolymerase
MWRNRFAIGFLCAGVASVQLAAEPERREWTVEGVSREALVCVPPQAKTSPVPVLFAFHGHGGNMQGAARAFGYHTLWPEALVVYMQGLPIPGVLTDPEGKKPGWQNAPGVRGDRDLKFFDAVLETLRTEHKVDEKHVFATGHSNGGGFVYLLWAERPYAFAAFAPCAAATRQLGQLTPRPALHLAGEKDRLVKFEWQQRMIDGLRKVNGCAGAGRPWGANATLYASASGTPLVALVHPGGHEFPKGAADSIIQFFQERMKGGER